MNLFVTGTEDRLSEFKKIVIPEVQAVYAPYQQPEEKNIPGGLTGYDMIVDLNLDEFPGRINLYCGLRGKLVVGCAVKKTLKEIISHASEKIQCLLVGFNSLPTFIERSKKEVSFTDGNSKQLFVKLAAELHWDWQQVKDETGMVTPRVIAMLINEACFTLGEGTALQQDIDTGMKLGTAYPYGPLEWADRIGINHVYETLLAIQQRQQDKRYAIAPLLEKMYLNKQSFKLP